MSRLFRSILHNEEFVRVVVLQIGSSSKCRPVLSNPCTSKRQGVGVPYKDAIWVGQARFPQNDRITSVLNSGSVPRFKTLRCMLVKSVRS